MIPIKPPFGRLQQLHFLIYQLFLFAYSFNIKLSFLQNMKLRVERGLRLSKLTSCVKILRGKS